MFGIRSDADNILDAIKRSQGTIEFTLDGKIVDANSNFLKLMGYDLREVVGQHHRIFVTSEDSTSAEYKEFWRRLRAGESFGAVFRRVAKDGTEVWIQATYNPVLDRKGKTYKIFKVATDVTESRLRAADHAGQVDAIRKSEAVIEFDLEGNISYANNHFLSAMGYRLEEIKGKHHRMFVDPAYAETKEYRDFWRRLAAGEYLSGEYQRYGKNGREVWIQASYNPIFDMAGRPFKVVKYAADVTETKRTAIDHAAQLEAVNKVEAAISFDMEGKVLDANKLFLDLMGYRLDEIKGKHHQMFVGKEAAQSAEYKEFWETLRNGKYLVSDFKRFAKNGKEVWIHASYNPVFDLNGKPFKVVKFASDITANMHARNVLQELAEGSSESAEMITSASEEMLASIREISQNMLKTQNIADEIVAKSDAAEEVRLDLEQTSEAMEGVVGIIRDLADQVNLLALNATIEAARAGDAGKGFAVVAGEVKSLATQTAKATDEIATQIESMQSITRRVTESTQDISNSAGSVADYVNAVASAVEEQTAVTQDISRNIEVVFRGIVELADCVRGIAK
ncbi:methyl-accepting chemotaxis protein [Thalassospira marina]|uniref:Histidine kinase n=1 Tax=Thalassospira marina TaxID=2048283 RepID=A0ABN5FD09_9PROT|nr:PAS domain-containing methyl-accepting chemotaxis protein [Thalassospira marina]AUG52643.1 histidine kinase [Thalassospira marina]